MTVTVALAYFLPQHVLRLAPMKLIDTFQVEHRLIDRALGSLRRYVDGLVDGSSNPQDGRLFGAFFIDFAGHFHHDREERVLFEALVTEADLPRDRGPVQALTRQHALMEAWMAELAPLLLECPPLSDDDRLRVGALATRYSHALWRHIDAENSVLYPESTERLAQSGIHELPDRPMSEAEAAARAAVESLLDRYPPIEDAVLARGDGCFMCPAYGESCDGLEAEWWSELEWDEFRSR